MACQDIQEDAQAYLDNELSPARRAQVEGHLAGCAACRKVVEELKTVSAVLSGWSAAPVGGAFKLGLEVKIAAGAPPEMVGGPATRQAPVLLSRTATRRKFSSFPEWFSRQWRPLAIAAGVFVVLTTVVMFSRAPAKPVTVVARASDVIGAFTSAPATLEIADATALASVVSKQTIVAQPLDATKVAQSDVLYAFLGSVDSQGDRDAGKKLINLLADARDARGPANRISIGAVLAASGSVFFSAAEAAEVVRDPLYIGRQYELQGRLKEAIATYQGADGVPAGRVAVAIAALRLRLGDCDGAQAVLEGAPKDGDRRLSLLASQLADEIRTARAAAAKLAVERAGVINTAEQWNKVALLEVAAYDFRNAASSFMKAAGAVGPDLTELAREARFRSAWCKVQSGQISTGIYGFKSMTPSSGKPTTIEYAAGIEEALGLARVGKFDESVAASKQLTALPAPTRSLEAVAYFQKGMAELYGLKDLAAAAESLGRVTSAGQGNLSYAAEVLLPGTH